MEFSNRKPNRLSDFSYSQYGSYFITVCTENKLPLLCTVQRGTVFEPPAVIHSRYGRIFEEQIQTLSHFYPDIRIDKYVIMPNHIHMIVTISKDNAPAEKSFNDRIPFLISTLKRFTNRKSGISLWQRSYYDHVIRNDCDYQNIWKYIEDNPAKWAEDRFYVEER